MFLLETSSKSYPRHQGIRSPRICRNTKSERDPEGKGEGREGQPKPEGTGHPVSLLREERTERPRVSPSLTPGVCGPHRRPHSTVNTVHMCVPGAQVGVWDAHLS